MKVQDLDAVDWESMQTVVARLMSSFDCKGINNNELIAAIGVMFISACKRTELRTGDVLTRCTNIIYHMKRGALSGPSKTVIDGLEMWLLKEFKDREYRPHEREVADRLGGAFGGGYGG